MNNCGDVDKFKDKFRFKLLNDLAANYAQVDRCYCAHKDRIQSVQENLKYNKRMVHLRTILIILVSLVLLTLAFLTGLGIGVGFSNSHYGRTPCIHTGPFWYNDECEVSY